MHMGCIRVQGLGVKGAGMHDLGVWVCGLVC